MTTIDELNRQRAERHRLVDATYDKRIARIVSAGDHVCEKEANIEFEGDHGRSIFVFDECPHCGAANANVNWELAKDQMQIEGGA